MPSPATACSSPGSPTCRSRSPPKASPARCARCWTRHDTPAGAEDPGGVRPGPGHCPRGRSGGAPQYHGDSRERELGGAYAAGACGPRGRLRRFERLQQTIGVRRTRGTVAAGLAVMSGEGKVLTDRIRELIAGMRDEEGRLLARRSATLAARTREVRIAVAGGTVLTLGLAVVASLLVGREQARRRQAEAALRPTQARLEHVVASSTVVIYGNEVTGSSFSPNWVSENVTRLTGYEV